MITIRTAGLVAAALAVAGCASQTRIEKLYEDPAAGSAPYTRLLVVGIAAGGAQRQQVEELIRDRLADSGVAAIAGFTHLGTSPVISQDALDETAATTGADGILIAHLVAATVTPEYRQERVDLRSECRGGNPIDLFLYDYRELREPASVTFAHEVTIVTNLYDAETTNRVWTIQSTCFDKSDFDAVLRREAEAIVRQLRLDGLIGRR